MKCLDKVVYLVKDVIHFECHKRLVNQLLVYKGSITNDWDRVDIRSTPSPMSCIPILSESVTS